MTNAEKYKLIAVVVPTESKKYKPWAFRFMYLSSTKSNKTKEVKNEFRFS